MTDVNVKVLAIICILLVAALIAVTAYFQVLVVGSLNSEIADRDHQISQLTYQNHLSNLSIRRLNGIMKDLNDTINLNKSQWLYDTSFIVTSPPFSGLDLPVSFIDIYHNEIGSIPLDSSFNYAGYIIVQINSTSDSTYINYTCASHVGTFYLQRDIGMNGTAMFPVLPLGSPYSHYPAEGIFMTVGTHAAVPAKINITATYHY